jgi:hypothetical protein
VHCCWSEAGETDSPRFRALALLQDWVLEPKRALSEQKAESTRLTKEQRRLEAEQAKTRHEKDRAERGRLAAAQRDGAALCMKALKAGKSVSF